MTKMNFKQALKRLLFRELYERLDYQEKMIGLLSKNIDLLSTESKYQTEITLSNYRALECIKSEQGLLEPFVQKDTIKYQV